MTRRISIVGLGVVPLLLAACSSAAPTASGSLDPANFTSTIDNPWLPMVPGTTLIFEGTKDDQRAVDTFEITSETKVIAGVTCVVVRDTLTLDGKLHEKTEDWYVQDRQGNVWYFGEQTAVYDAAGNITSTSGTWQAGVAGARPGIFMPADPKIGQSFQQRLLLLLSFHGRQQPWRSYGGIFRLQHEYPHRGLLRGPCSHGYINGGWLAPSI